MNDLKSQIVVGNDKQPTIKDMAYGGAKPISNILVSSNLYRLRRGYPFPRAGKLVVATPQFKTLTLYSPTTKNRQVQGNTVTPISITYPTITR